MKKTKIKTKLSKRQKRNTIIYILLVILGSFIFTGLFAYAIGILEGERITFWLLFSFFGMFFIVSMLFFPVLVIAVVLGLQKGRARRINKDVEFVPVENITYYRDTVKCLSPAMFSILVDLDLYGQKDVVATLLSMHKKKAIAFADNGDIQIAPTISSTLDSSEVELKRLIERRSLNDKFSLKAWKNNRFIEAEKNGYIFKNNDSTYKKSMIRLAVIWIISLIVAGGIWTHIMTSISMTTDTFVESMVWYLIMDIFIFVPTYILARHAAYRKRGDVVWQRTALGNEMSEKIAGLQHFIKDFSNLADASKEQLALWDEYLMYAVILEENKKIIRDICKANNLNLQKFKYLGDLY